MIKPKPHPAMFMAAALACVSGGAVGAAPASNPQVISIQRFIDQAPAGSTVVVPPGFYRAGARIDKPLTIRLKGVRILGSTAGKAIILVTVDHGAVTIEDFTATEGWNCSSGNCAGIKAEGIGFDLTLRRIHLANQIMGVLIDGRGRSLTIEDSLIEQQGHLRGDLSHLVYGGEIARLVIRNTTLRRSRHLGHLLKSRAAETVVEGSRLLGLDGNHSRSIDLPCGGTLILRNSVIQHGANSDNADLFSVGTEPKNCRLIRPGHIVMTNNWIISDRRATATDPTKPPVPNTLFTWRSTGNNRLTATGNRIVNIARWSGDKSWPVPDLGVGNTLYTDRAAAGLGANEIPRLPGR